MEKKKPLIIPKEITPDMKWDADKWLEYTKEQKIEIRDSE